MSKILPYVTTHSREIYTLTKLDQIETFFVAERTKNCGGWNIQECLKIDVQKLSYSVT